MITLTDLAADIPGSKLIGRGDVELHGLTDHSRSIKPGYLFVAVKGSNCDGHRFVASAVENGASAVIIERHLDGLDGMPALIVPDSRVALATAAAMLHGRPGRKLNAVGVTGTNGKSTTAFMIRSILDAAGYATGLLGTIKYCIGPQEFAADMTTPGPVEMQHFLEQMVRANTDYCVLEASSHALDQHRVDHVNFNAAAFTNITENEHQDYHGDFNHYLQAKLKLFEMLQPRACAAVNAADKHADAFIEASNCEVLRYGSDDADVRADVKKKSLDGTVLAVSTPVGRAGIAGRFIGSHNTSNALAAITTAVGLGIKLEHVQEGLAKFTGVPGRLERVDCGQDFNLFIDYAHTHDALRTVLLSLRRLVQGRLIVVFGCGGDRDRSKRPKMGDAAHRLADLSILTADNSRSENTEDIIEEILDGFTDSDAYEVCPDRRMAIRHAIAEARPSDTVLIAGKGHETTQTANGSTHCFCDAAVARCWLRQRIETESSDVMERAENTA